MGTILEVPYKSQVSKTAGYSFNDCGPACIAMMMAATGQDMTIDSLYRHPSIRGQRGGIAISALQTLSKAYGVPLKFARLNLDTLRQTIDSGRPLMTLIDYKPIADNKLNGIPTRGVFGHFCLVVGYDDDSIVVHDPYWKTSDGAYRHWPTAVFNKAWAGGAGSWGNTYNGQSLYPANPIAQPQTPAGPSFPMDEGMWRRIRAKALFEKDPVPVITNQAEYDQAVAWLGGWGQYAVGYYIQPGDTLGSIAQQRFGLADFASGLAAYNGITNPSQIAIGQKILIPLPSLPGTGETPPPTAYNFTNRDVINAFYTVYRSRGGDSDDYWQAIVDAGLEDIANSRDVKYSGPPIRELPNVPYDARLAVATLLGV